MCACARRQSGRPAVASIRIDRCLSVLVPNAKTCACTGQVVANGVSVCAGKVGGLRSHRWLVMAADSKVVIQDLVSGRAREAVRTLWGGKDPTALAFLYANAARLLGFDAGTNANEVVLGPLLAVGTTAGTTTLMNFVTLQVMR